MLLLIYCLLVLSSDCLRLCESFVFSSCLGGSPVLGSILAGCSLVFSSNWDRRLQTLLISGVVVLLFLLACWWPSGIAAVAPDLNGVFSRWVLHTHGVGCNLIEVFLYISNFLINSLNFSEISHTGSSSSFFVIANPITQVCHPQFFADLCCPSFCVADARSFSELVLFFGIVPVLVWVSRTRTLDIGLGGSDASQEEIDFRGELFDKVSLCDLSLAISWHCWLLGGRGI